MSELNQKALETVTALREVVNKRLSDQDVLLQNSEKRLSEEVGRLSQQISDNFVKAEAERKKLEANIETLSASAGAVNAGGKGAKAQSKFAKALNTYLKTGQAVSAEIAESAVRELIEKKLPSNSDNADLIVKSMLVGSNVDGGYFVTPDRQDVIMGRIFETSPIRALATVTTTVSDRVERVLDDDQAASGGWVGETAARPNTNTPQIGLITISTHEQHAYPLVTNKMLDDAGFDVEGWLSDKIADKLSRDENTAFVIGDGSQKPKGFLTYPAWASAGVYERQKIEQVNSGVSGGFTGDSFKNLKASLKEDYQRNAVWGMKRSVWGAVSILKGSDGHYLLDPALSFKNGDELMLLGKKVVLMDDMPAAGANLLSVVYGDFKRGYEIVDRIGLRILRDPYSNKPYVGLYAVKRTGGDVISYDALKIMKLA